MSAVETIRDIPVIVEHRKNFDVDPMLVDNDYDDSGFPFDNNSRRSRDPLEDIAQRHPEFAQHLQGFPRRSYRPEQEDDEFIRRFERPFASGRFERFFPFNREDFEREPQRFYDAYPEYFQNFEDQNQQHPEQSQQGTSQSPQPQQQYTPQHSQTQTQFNQPSQQPESHNLVTQGTQTELDTTQSGEETETPVQKEEVGHTRGRPIQQSNTVDLGQKQPVDEAVNDRNQRSMSAPPENKRFTSSVNIPMGGHQGQESSKPQSQSSGSGSTERVIPIHVEGRDDPIIPKHFSQTGSQPQPERIFSDSPRPQSERIFGQRPEHFTQFVHRDPHSRFQNDWHTSSFDRGFPEEEFGFARSGSPSRFASSKPAQSQTHGTPQQQQQYRQEHVPQQTEQQPQHQEQKQAAPEPPKPQPPKQPAGPIEQIQAIQKDVSTLLRQVDAFGGIPKDKNYLYLDEMLTRNLLKLDNVDTQGQDSIRSARKEAIKSIEKAISHLEAKAAANVAQKEQKKEVEQQASQEPEKMEASQNDQSQVTEGSSQTTNEIEIASSQPVPESNQIQEGSSTEQESKSEQSSTNNTVQATTDEKTKVDIEDAMEVANDTKTENAKVEEAAQVEAKPDTPQNQPSAEEQPQQDTKSEQAELKEKKKIKKKVNNEEKEKKQ